MDENGYDIFVLIVINILNSDFDFLVFGVNFDKVEVVFDKKLND